METATSETQQQGNNNYGSRLTGGVVCRDCGKVFPTQCHLNEHRKIHTSRKPYNCEICGKQFSVAKSVKSHIKTIHNKERPFTCQLCLLAFTQKCYLKKHMLRRHYNAVTLQPSEPEVPKPERRGRPKKSSKPKTPQPLRPLLPKKS